MEVKTKVYVGARNPELTHPVLGTPSTGELPADMAFVSKRSSKGPSERSLSEGGVRPDVDRAKKASRDVGERDESCSWMYLWGEKVSPGWVLI